MQVGDLVKFHSDFFTTTAYANPGIIIKVHAQRVPAARSTREVYTVMWADQTVTNEHRSYLKPLTSS